MTEFKQTYERLNDVLTYSKHRVAALLYLESISNDILVFCLKNCFAIVTFSTQSFLTIYSTTLLFKQTSLFQKFTFVIPMKRKVLMAFTIDYNLHRPFTKGCRSCYNDI